MLKQPLLTVKSINETTGVTGSQSFVLQNTDANVFVGKLTVTTLTGTSPTLDVYFQTSDDSGTTNYDVVHFAQATGAITNANALFVKFGDLKGSGGYVGTATTQTLAAGKVNGLPLLGRYLNVAYVYGGTIATANATITIYEVDQDAR